MSRRSLAALSALVLAAAAAWWWMHRERPEAREVAGETAQIDGPREPLEALAETPAAQPEPSIQADELQPEAAREDGPRLHLRGSIVSAFDGEAMSEVELRIGSPARAEATSDARGAVDLALEGDAWKLGALASARVIDGDGLVRFAGLVRLEQDFVIVANEPVVLRGGVEGNFRLGADALHVAAFVPPHRALETRRYLAHAEADETGWFEMRVVLDEPLASLSLEVRFRPDFGVTVEVPVAALASEQGARVAIELAQLRVHVVDDDGLALRGARIVAAQLDAGREATPLSADSDASGLVELELPLGTVELYVASTGFAPRVEELELSPPVEELELALERARLGEELFGFVVRDTSEPVVGATVSAVPATRVLDLERAAPNETTTDARGQFRLPGHASVAYELRARDREPSVEAELLAYTDGGPHTLWLARPCILEIDLQSDALPGPFRAGAIEGVVLERRSRRVVPFSSEVVPFALGGLAAGEYEVYALVPGLEGCGEGFAALFSGERATALVPLRPARWITGVVRDERYATYPGVQATAFASWPDEVENVLCSDRTQLDGSFRAFASHDPCSLAVRYGTQQLDRRSARSDTPVEIVLP